MKKVIQIELLGFDESGYLDETGWDIDELFYYLVNEFENIGLGALVKIVDAQERPK